MPSFNPLEEAHRFERQALIAAALLYVLLFTALPPIDHLLVVYAAGYVWWIPFGLLLFAAARSLALHVQGRSSRLVLLLSLVLWIGVLTASWMMSAHAAAEHHDSLAAEEEEAGTASL